MVRKSKKYEPRNEGIFNPETGVLLVSCRLSDLIIEQDGQDRVTVLVDNFVGGIEIIHDSDRLWRPA